MNKKLINSNVKACLERILQIAEWSAHIPDRKEKEEQYLKLINKYRRMGYTMEQYYKIYDEYIVRVNAR